MISLKESITKIVLYCQKKRPLKTTLIAIFDPLFFLLYLIILGKGSFGNASIELFRIKAFFSHGGNVHSLNPLFYLPLSIVFHISLSSLKGYILVNVNPLTFEDFIKKQYGTMAMWIGGVNVIHILVWFVGMEGNLFILFFPFLILSLSLQAIYLIGSPFWCSSKISSKI